MTEELQDGERGATATEYAVLVGFIALVIVIGVTAFGSALETYYEGAVATVKTALGLP
jgi:pilus assembly protein Flp/PilA